jgi:hypothetical protein
MLYNKVLFGAGGKMLGAGCWVQVLKKNCINYGNFLCNICSLNLLAIYLRHE